MPLLAQVHYNSIYPAEEVPHPSHRLPPTPPSPEYQSPEKDEKLKGRAKKDGGRSWGKRVPSVFRGKRL